MGRGRVRVLGQQRRLGLESGGHSVGGVGPLWIR